MGVETNRLTFYSNLVYFTTMSQKKKTGTREWAESSYNIGVGCAHDCRYCYARSMSKRAGTIKSDAEWTSEKLKTKMPSTSKKKGWVMFPTTHDITPFYLTPAIETLTKLLANGNNVLIVSKPHLECIKALCEALALWRGQILFRFTIGTSDEDTAKFWEPGAPSINERLACLFWAYKEGFATSVSMEPMLSTVEETLELFKRMSSCVTDKIWIGKMNKIDARVAKVDDAVVARCQDVMEFQTDDKIMWLVDQLRDNPVVAWKDSIKEVIEKYEQSR